MDVIMIKTEKEKMLEIPLTFNEGENIRHDNFLNDLKEILEGIENYSLEEQNHIDNYLQKNEPNEYYDSCVLGSYYKGTTYNLVDIFMLGYKYALMRTSLIDSCIRQIHEYEKLHGLPDNNDDYQEIVEDIIDKLIDYKLEYFNSNRQITNEAFRGVVNKSILSLVEKELYKYADSIWEDREKNKK